MDFRYVKIPQSLNGPLNLWLLIHLYSNNSFVVINFTIFPRLDIAIATTRTWKMEMGGGGGGGLGRKRGFL